MPSNYDKIREDNIREYGEGTRHLSFLGRLYTDRTHFIFELLQNAEDAGASRILFTLLNDRLEMSHDGRPFNESDVRGVCGVGEGTKAEDLTQIGKFGIGFKSVYAYTTKPEVHSSDENFRIENYVRPYAVKARSIEDSWTTLFVLVFDALGIDIETACREIGACLRNLNARTLLFLRKIKEIEYKLPDTDGVYLREEAIQGSARRVEVLGQNNGQVENENWLIFERPVMFPDNSGQVPVEVGFRIETNNEDKNESIVRIDQSQLVVYFPTEKDTRLGFLIQGPYRTTPARDNIPQNDTWNKKLIKETAELAVEALGQLKEMGLLSVSLLETLPIRTDDFPEGNMFYPIFSRVSKAFMNKALLPANDGTFVTARNAKIAGSERLIDLLNSDQLCLLFQTTSVGQWLLSDITERRTPDLWQYLRYELKVVEVDPDMFARRVSEQFLASQDDKWFIKFYTFLSEQRALWRSPRWRYDTAGVLLNEPILRLQDGTHVKPFEDDGSPNAYLAVGMDADTSSSIVKIELSQDEEVRKFLKDLGVPELDIVEEVIDNILPEYMSNSSSVPVTMHMKHIKKIAKAYKTDSQEKKKRLWSKLLETPFILTEMKCPSLEEPIYLKPDEVYFESKELRMYFSGNDSCSFISSKYPKSAKALFKDLEVVDFVRVKRKDKDGRGHVIIRQQRGDHLRGLDGFDPRITVDGLKFVMDRPNPEKSAFIWNEIAVPNSDCIRGILETSTRQSYEDSKKIKLSPSSKLSTEIHTMIKVLFQYFQSPSSFSKLLTEIAWLPDSNGNMHKPSDIALDDLPETFIRNERLADQLGMKKDVVAKLAEEVGISTEDIELLTQDPEGFRQWKAERESKEKKPEFPERVSANPERRKKQLRNQVKDDPEKDYGIKERSVRITRKTIDPPLYLKENYTNNADQLICQICKGEMPFKKRDSEYYFEAVEALSGDCFHKEHEAQFLALCPECAARYKEFVKREETNLNKLHHTLLDSNKLEVSLKLGELETSLRFVETHWQDMKTILQIPVVDRSDTWSEQDQKDLTTASLKYAAALYPEEEDLV